jgi:light-regulated signal transduction histidine kinase (bacteriophytochrome)
VLDRKQPLLFSHWERRYPYLSHATPLAEEGLLVPFFVRGRAVGTIWAIAHDDRRTFDREDLRQLESLGRFASGAYEAWTCMEALEQQKVALQRSHDELADTLAELRTTNGDLEQFAYSASHDLIEPIRTIVTFSEILDRSYGEVLATEGRLYLSFLGASARRLEVLVKGLRLYTHSTLARDGEATVVEATAALERALADLDAAICKAGASVTHGVLPAVSVRETQLEQVFQNLIGNAIKYRKNDEPARIHVSAETQGDQWLFSVRDNGIGIAPEYRWKIFGLFKRLHSGDAYEGAGLGLAICKKIVERNGGRIWMESEGPGHGSVFYFTLPMRESRVEPEVPM